VGGNARVFEAAAGSVDRGDEAGPAFGRVVESDAHGNGAAGGEADDADSIGRDSPLWSVLSNVRDSGLTVGNRQRDDFADLFDEFLAIRCVQGHELLRGIVARLRDAIFQDKRSDALGGEIFRDVDALAVDGESHESAAWGNDDAGAIRSAGRGPEDGKSGLGYVRHDFGVPGF